MISKDYKIASLVLLLKLGKQPFPLWAMQEESCTSVQLSVVIICYLEKPCITQEIRAKANLQVRLWCLVIIATTH